MKLGVTSDLERKCWVSCVTNVFSQQLHWTAWSRQVSSTYIYRKRESCLSIRLYLSSSNVWFMYHIEVGHARLSTAPLTIALLGVQGPRAACGQSMALKLFIFQRYGCRRGNGTWLTRWRTDRSAVPPTGDVFVRSTRFRCLLQVTVESGEDEYDGTITQIVSTSTLFVGRYIPECKALHWKWYISCDIWRILWSDCQKLTRSGLNWFNF